MLKEENKKIRVLIATPTYDSKLDVSFVDSYLRTLAEAPKHNVEMHHMFLGGESLLCKGRDSLYRIAYKQQVDVLFFIDADVFWEPDNFFSLVLSPKDLIGGTYRKKHDREELFAFKAESKINEDGLEDYNLEPDENGLLEVFGLPCGFMKISKRCLNKMWENCKDKYKDESGETASLFQCVINEDGHFISEDINFCRQWNALGEKTYLQTNFTCGHNGSKAYTGDVKSWLADWRIKIDDNNNKEKVAIKMLKPYFSKEEVAHDPFYKIL